MNIRHKLEVLSDNFFVIIMFGLSSVFTVKTLVQDASNSFDFVLLILLGIAFQIGIAKTIIYLVKFIKNKNKFLVVVAFILFCLLVSVSIKCNIDYTNSIDNKKQIETKSKNKNYILIKKELSECKKDLNAYKKEKQEVSAKIDEVSAKKQEMSAKVSATYSDGIPDNRQIEMVESYKNEVNALGKQLDDLNASECKNKVNNLEVNAKRLQEKLYKTPEYIINKSSFSNNKFRIFFGILIEFLTYLLFIFKVYSTSIEKKEPILVKKPEIIKKEPILVKKELKTTEKQPKIIKINKKESLYLKFIKENKQNNGVIPTDREVISKINISQRQITKEKKDLLDQGILIKQNNRIYLKSVV